MDSTELKTWLTVAALATSVLTAVLTQGLGWAREVWGRRKAQEERRAHLDHEAAGRATKDLARVRQSYEAKGFTHDEDYRLAVRSFVSTCEDLYSAEFRSQLNQIRVLLLHARDNGPAYYCDRWSRSYAFNLADAYLRSTLGAIRRGTAEGRLDYKVEAFDEELTLMITAAADYDGQLEDVARSEMDQVQWKREQKRAEDWEHGKDQIDAQIAAESEVRITSIPLPESEHEIEVQEKAELLPPREHEG